MKKKIFIVAFISLLIDQISKIIIDTTFKIDEVNSIIPNFFSLTRVGNTGAAFSILEGSRILLIIFSFAALFFLIKYIKDFKETKLGILSLGLIIGGILGNLIDRLFLGYVRDFLKFNIFGYNYPVFNIADSCIVVGVIILIICIFRGDDKNENSSK